MFNDIFTLISLGIAVFIFLRLRSVLGRRTGQERRPPLEGRDPLSRLPSRRPPADPVDPARDNVVTLPRRKDGEADAPSPGEAAINTLAEPGTPLNRGLREVLKADPSFVPSRFLEGAKMAYEMIVSAYAEGDQKTLRDLLSREVYDGFAQAIEGRAQRGEKVQSSFVGIDEARIVGAEMDRSDSRITVRFVSQIISATLDKAGTVIDGDAEQVAEVVDLWTFARDTRSRDPNWKLVATESGA